MSAKLPPEELNAHALNCESRLEGYLEQCTCKPRTMTEEEFGELFTRLEALAKKDPWAKFERDGIQIDVFEAYQKHPTNLFECWVQGPNQIWKSTSTQEIVKDALKRENKYRKWTNEPMHILVMTPKQNTQYSGFQKRFQELNPKWITDHMKGRPALKGQSKAWAAIDFDNGDHIQFETFDAGVQYIEVVSAHLIILDDGVEYYSKFYPFLFQRGVHHKAVIHGSFIPPPPTDPFYKLIIEPAKKGIKEPLREVILGDEKHYIAANGYELYEMCKRNYPKRVFLQKVCGENVGSGRLVYDDFDENINIIPEDTLVKFGTNKEYKLSKLPEDYCRFIWGDWANTDNPDDMPAEKKRKTVGIFCAIPPPGTEIKLPNGLSVFSEEDDPVLILYNGYECTKRKIAEEHAQSIIDLWEDRGYWVERFEEILWDAATGTKDGTVDKSVFEVLEECFAKAGNPRVYKATNKRKFSTKDAKEQVGHDLVASLIKRRKLLILKNGKTDFIIDSFLSYEMDDKTNQPQIYGDDEQDAIRYGANSKPKWSDPELLIPSPYILPDPDEELMSLFVERLPHDGITKYLGSEKRELIRRY